MGGREPRCPVCDTEAKPIVWGLPAQDPGPDVILGGCVLPPEPASWGCPACGWRGTPGPPGTSGPPHDREQMRD